MRRAHLVGEYLRLSLWVVPALGAVVAVAAGLATIELDHLTRTRVGFTGGADGARAVLSTIAAAMITFTGLVFSILIVALQLASAQFSPRVMRTFLRDRSSKIALATFVATFSYAFTVLRATRVDAVPGISVNVAIVLVFVSIAVFIHYINHTAQAIRASAIIESVAEETRASIERCYPDDLRPVPALRELGDADAAVAHEGAPGVVTGFDAERIVAAAKGAGAVVVLRVGIGDFVPTGAPLLDLHGADADGCAVTDCISFARERTMHQDPAFGLRQLVDLAAKALSPGINDPTTAVQAIDQIHDILRRLAPRPLPAGRRADDAGHVRLIFPTMDWDGFVSLAVDEIRHYGAGSLQVTRRLRGMLEDLLTIVGEDRRAALIQQGDLLTSATRRHFQDRRDREMAGQPDAQGLGS